MAGTVTLTGTAGPANTVSAVPFTDVSEVHLDMNKNMIQLVQGSIVRSPISIGAATTVVATKSGSNWTLTIS